jgi:hypothetical protein
MSNEDSKSKDTFDKANSSVSSLSTFVLMVIAVINAFIAYQSFGLQEKTGAIQNQLEIVKNNAQTVELIEKLSINLADSSVKKDIALIALNRKIADNDDKSKIMVTEIATQVYRTGIKDLITKASSQNQNSSEAMKWTPEYKNTFVALAIIGERNPNLANTLIQELNDQKTQLFDALFMELIIGKNNSNLANKFTKELNNSQKNNQRMVDLFDLFFMSSDGKKVSLSGELDKQVKELNTFKMYKKFIEENGIKEINNEDKKIKSIEQMRIIDPTKSTKQITEIVEQIKAIKQITGAFDFSIAIYYNNKDQDNNKEQETNVNNFHRYLKKQNYSMKDPTFVKNASSPDGGYSQKNGKSVSAIKYFHSGDQGQAEHLKKILLDYVNLPENKKWTNENLPISDTDLLEFVQWKSPNGRIEVWLYFPPSPQK